MLRLTGNVWMDSRIWEGSAMTPNGDLVEWSAVKIIRLEENLLKKKLQLTQLGQNFLPFYCIRNY